MRSLLAWLCILCLSSSASGYQTYRSLIPNGYTVTVTCFNFTWTWNHVGHGDYPPSSHNLNPFGVRFRDFQHNWNQTLCMEDSDGDGISNGMELGVDDCQFPYYHQNPVSHPGIDERLYCEQLRTAAVGDCREIGRKPK